jgi:hypothetical protein
MPLPLTLSTSRGQTVSVVRTASPSHPSIPCWKLRNSHEDNVDDRDALILSSNYRLSRTLAHNLLNLIRFYTACLFFR